MTRGKRCEAHVHGYLAPEEHHHLRPQSRGGTTEAANMVWLCANAHSDVHYFLDLIEGEAVKLMRQLEMRPIALGAAVSAVPWRVAERYAPKVRQIARRGWDLYAEEFLDGVWEKHHLLWLSSGDPRDPDHPGPGRFCDAVRHAEVPRWLATAGVVLAARNLGNGER